MSSLGFNVSGTFKTNSFVLVMEFLMVRSLNISLTSLALFYFSYHSLNSDILFSCTFLVKGEIRHFI